MGRNGGPKSGGRKKGSLNKTTELLFDLIDKKRLEPLEGFRKSIKELEKIKCYEASDKISVVNAKIGIYMDIMKYLYPRRKAVELVNNDENKSERIIKIQWADEDDKHTDSEDEKTDTSSNSDQPVTVPV